MSSIFISHSSRDNATAAVIQDWLTKQGYSSHFLDFDPQNGIPAGRNWERELYRQLKASQAVVALCSEHSMASEWCFAELTQSRALGKPVFAVRIDGCDLKPLFRQEQTVDFVSNQTEALERLARGLKLAGLDPRDSFKWDEGRPPFPGLRAFEEADAAVFFGRDETIQQTLELLKRLRLHQNCRFVLMLGASGSGKSSLVRAGVLPRLRKDPGEWLPLQPCRPRESPLNEFSVAFANTFARYDAPKDWKTVREQFRRAVSAYDPAPLIDLAYDLRTASKSAEASVVITLDQFEELFARPQDDAVHLLSETLRLSIASENSPFLLIGVLRSDFLGQFQSVEPWSRLKFEDVPVGPLAPGDIAEIIEKPAQVAALDLEPGLVQAMLADAPGGDTLALLAFALRQLWDKFGSTGRLTVDNYRKGVGGMQGLLARSADEGLQGELQSEAVAQSVRRAFSSLVRVTETGQFARQAARWEAMPELARSALEKLIKARLLVTWTENNSRMVEVTHETLFRAWDQLAEWLEKDREFLLWQRRLATGRAEWERTNKDEGALLRGGLLSEAEHWAAEYNTSLTPEDAAFVAASIELRQRERTEQEIREWNTRLEAARAFYERSFVLAEQRRFQSAAACLLRGLEIAPQNGAPKGYPAQWGRPAWTEEAWTYYRYLDQQRGHMAARLTGKTGILSCLCVGQGLSIAVTGSVDGSMQLWHLPSRQSLGTFDAYGVAVTCVALSDRRRRLLRGSVDGQIVMVDLDEGVTVIQDATGEAVTSIAFSSDERWILAGNKLGAIDVWDAETGKPFTSYKNHSSSVTYLNCDAERKVIASGCGRPAIAEWLGDGGVQLWDMSSRRIVGAVWPRLGDGSVGSVAVSTDFQMALKGFETGDIQLWKMGSGEQFNAELIRTLKGHSASVTSLEFSPDGRRALSGSMDNTAWVWNLETGEELMVLEGHKDPVLSVAFGPLAEWALTASFDGSVAVWDLGQLKQRRHFACHSVSLSSVAVSSDCKRILSGGNDTVARVWDFKTNQCVATLGRYVEPILAVAVSADARTCFSGSQKGSVLAWDLENKCIARVFEGHKDEVWDISVSPDGSMLLSASSDQSIRLWNLATGELVRVLSGHNGTVYGVAFSTDGNRVASGSADGSLRIWDLQGNKDARVLRFDRNNGINAVAWSPIAAVVLAATGNGTLELWDVAAGKKIRECRGHQDHATCVVFSPDGKLAASGSLDSTARVWDVESGKELFVCKLHSGPVYDISVSPDGSAVLTGSKDQTARLWSVRTGEQINGLSGHTDTVWAVAFSPDSSLIVTGSLDSRIAVWEYPLCTFRNMLQEGHAAEINSVAFAPDGVRAVTASKDGSLCLWKTDTGSYLGRLAGPAFEVSSVAISDEMIVAGYGDRFKRITDPLAFGPVQGRITFNESGSGLAILWDAVSPKGARLDRHGDVVSCVAFDATGRLALSGSYDNTARLWDVQTGRQVRMFRGHSAGIWSVVLNAKDSRAITGSIDWSIRVWDLETGQQVRTLEGHTGGVGALWCSDRLGLLSGSADKTVGLWDLQTGALIRRFDGHAAGVTCVAATSGGKAIASGSFDGTVRIWNAESGEVRRVLEHQDTVWCLALDPQGTSVATGCQDGAVRLWELESGRLVRAMQGNHGGINAVLMTADGCIIAGSERGSIQIWEAHSQEPVPILLTSGAGVLSLALSPDGKRLLSGWEDGLARISNLDESGESRTLYEQMGDVLGTAMHPQTRRIVLGSADCLIWVWDATGECMNKLAGDTAAVSSVALSPDGAIAASGSLDGSIRVWDLKSGTTLRVLKGHTKGVLSVVICPDGKAALSSSADGTVRLWDLKTGKQLRLLSNTQAETLAVSPDGRTAVVGRGKEIELISLLGEEVPLEPPVVHASDSEDPYRDFTSFYKSVGLRVIRDEPDMGELELV